MPTRIWSTTPIGPSANDTFWPYAYDDLYDGIFGAYAPDATAYADVPAAVRRSVPRGIATGVAAGGMAQVCSGQTSGLTDWPIERIAQQVMPTDRAGLVARPIEECHRASRGPAQVQLPDRCAQHPDRPAGRDAPADRAHAAGGADGAPRARQVLRLAERRAEGALHRARIRRRPQGRPHRQAGNPISRRLAADRRSKSPAFRSTKSSRSCTPTTPSRPRSTRSTMRPPRPPPR